MKTITAKEAEQIAAKLNAELEERRGHKIAYVRWQGKFIAHYGIRRGSKALDLARCPLSKIAYFNLLRTRGKLPAEEPTKQQKLVPKKSR